MKNLNICGLSKDYVQRNKAITTELYCQQRKKLVEVLEACGQPIPKGKGKMKIADTIVSFVQEKCPDSCMLIDYFLSD